MSKGNMLLGQARGKVGDVVFYVRNGIQQTRPRNRQPQNPQTYAQMAQRVKMAAPVLFYRRQRDFFKYAYKKKQNESFYNAFIRYNINIAPYLTREQVTDGVKAPAPYIIADGNLAPVKVLGAMNAGTSLTLKTDILTSRIATWGDFRRDYSLNYGDMLTVVGFATQGMTSPRMERIIEQHVFDVASDNMPIGYDMARASWQGGGSTWSVGFNSEDFGLPEWGEVGAAIVLSSNRGGVECSFAQLTLSDTAQFVYEELRSEEQLQLAIASYSTQSDAILDPQNADGNEVEFMPLFSDESLTQTVSSVTIAAGSDKNVYFDASKFPLASGVRSVTLSGAVYLQDITLPEDGVINIETREGTESSGILKLNLIDVGNKVLYSAILGINV